MKQVDETPDLLPEYDFARMAGGVRGRFAAAFRRGTNLVRLDSDVARSFKTDESVNEALRAVIKAAEAIRPVMKRTVRRRSSVHASPQAP